MATPLPGKAEVEPGVGSPLEHPPVADDRRPVSAPREGYVGAIGVVDKAPGVVPVGPRSEEDHDVRLPSLHRVHGGDRDEPLVEERDASLSKTRKGHPQPIGHPGTSAGSSWGTRSGLPGPRDGWRARRRAVRQGNARSSPFLRLATLLVFATFVAPALALSRASSHRPPPSCCSMPFRAAIRPGPAGAAPCMGRQHAASCFPGAGTA